MRAALQPDKPAPAVGGSSSAVSTVSEKVVLSFNALKGKDYWLFSQAELVRRGFMVTSVDSGSGICSVLVTSGNVGYVLRSNGSLDFLDGTVTERGVFVVGASPEKPSQFRLSIMIDNGSEMNLAGRNYRSVLIQTCKGGRCVCGVGGCTQSEATGRLEIVFPPHKERLQQVTASYWLPHAVVDRVVSYPGSTAAPLVQGSRVMSFVARGASTASPEAKSSGDFTPGRFATITDPALIAKRLHVYNFALLQQLHKKARGVRLTNPKMKGIKDIASEYGISRRCRTRHKRTEESIARDAALKPGESWSMDITAKFTPDLEGNKYAVVFLDRVSGFIFKVLLKEKNAPSVVDAFRKLRNFVARRRPGTRVKHLHGDQDPAWADSHGEVKPNAFVTSWNLDLPEPIRFTFSPANTQALNFAEGGAMARIWPRFNMNMQQGVLGDAAWSDCLTAAAEQINAVPAPSSRDPLKRAESPYAILFERKPDLSGWVAHVGQSVFVHVHGAKANRGRVCREPAYFICPTESGFLVRMLGDQKLKDVYHITVVDCDLARHAQLALSDDLGRASPQLVGNEKLYQQRLRQLFARDPGKSPSDLLVIHDPLTQLPMRLVSFLEDGDLLALREVDVGEPIHDEESESAGRPRGVGVQEGSTASAPPAAVAAPAPEPEAVPSSAPGAQPVAVAPSAGPSLAQAGPGSGAAAAPPGVPPVGFAPLVDLPTDKLSSEARAWLKSLPGDTPLWFNPGKTRRGESGQRYTAFMVARTVDEYKRLNPVVKWRQADLVWNAALGHVSFPNGLQKPGVVMTVKQRERAERRFKVLRRREAARQRRSTALLARATEYLLTREPAASHTPSAGGLGPSVATASAATSAWGDLRGTMVGAVDRDHESRKELERSIAETDPIMARILEMERSEEMSPEPSFAGAAAAYALVYACLVGEGVAPDSARGSHLDPDSGLYAGLVFVSTDPECPKNVAEAMRRPDWEFWREAILKELLRISEQHKCWKVVPGRRKGEAERQYGSEKVSTHHLVMVLSIKRNANGEISRYKARLAVADKKDIDRDYEVYSASVAPDSIRFLTSLTVRKGGTAEGRDVAGAYLFGQPEPYDSPNGRVILARIPEYFDDFFPELGIRRKDEHGRDNFLEITGNLPGRQDAGRIWGKRYADFLKECGFVQSAIDLRVFVKAPEDKSWLIVVGVYVDDNRILRTPGSEAAWAEFDKKWEAEFEKNPDPSTVTDFCGVRYDKLQGGGYGLSCGKLLLRLHQEIAKDSHAVDYKHDSPMAEDALTRLFRVRPEAKGKEDYFMKKARTILGIGGYVVCQTRPDAYFAFIVLSQLVGRGLTNDVWKAILRWAWYLVNTKHLKLCYRPEGRGDWMAYTDSSLANAEGAGSYGGAAFLFPGSGLFAWMVKVPKAKTDSTGGAELLMASLACKAVLGWRIFSRELSHSPQGPTTLATDSTVTVDSISRESVSHQQRYVGIRMAIVRETVDRGAVRLTHVPSSENLADIFTKPLVGVSFLRLRERVLGCPKGGVETVD